MEERIIKSINKYLSGTATNEEKALVEALLERGLDAGSPVAELTKEEKERSRLKMWDAISHATIEEERMNQLFNAGHK